MDPRTGALVVDRVLPGSLGYPAAYGVFPCTLAGDDDPLDVQQTIQRFFSIYKPGADIQLNGWADSTVARTLLADAIAAARQ